MRKAAGIMLIVFGALSLIVTGTVQDVIAWEGATSIEEFASIRFDMGVQAVPAELLLIALIVGGGICTLLKKVYWWAFSGAFCLVLAGITGAAFYASRHASLDGALGGMMTGGLYALPGLLAVIFLAIRKGEFRKPPPSEQKFVED